MSPLNDTEFQGWMQRSQSQQKRIEELESHLDAVREKYHALAEEATEKLQALDRSQSQQAEEYRELWQHELHMAARWFGLLAEAKDRIRELEATMECCLFAGNSLSDDEATQIVWANEAAHARALLDAGAKG